MHCSHFFAELDRAFRLGEQVAAALPAHIASLTSVQLVQFTAISIFSMHHAARRLGSSEGTLNMVPL